MRPLYIFDLDGTLALIDHRRHMVERPSRGCSMCGGKNPRNCVECADLDAGWKADWTAFFAACVDDRPNVPVIQTLQSLRRGGAEVWIWSGRSDEVRTQTVKWLCEHGCFGPGINTLPAWPFGAPERFRMRPAGDFTADVDLKRGWLAAMEPPEFDRLAAVFDDRQSVVDMWRGAGVTCFQVAPGDF